MDQVALSTRGFRNDRRWMLIDAGSVFITQRKHAKLSLVDVSLNEKGIGISAPGMSSIELPYALDGGDHIPVTVWKDTCDALMGDRLFNEWFSDFLGEPVRVVYMPDSTSRHVDANFHVSDQDIVSFADGFPFLLISEASLEELNKRLESKGESTVSIKRFRPNIVVDGCAPHEEDSWKEFRIGNVSFYGVKPCSRCIVTTIDYTTGVRGAEPLKTLKEYRQKNNKVFFGMNIVHQAGLAGVQILQTGQLLEVVRR